MSRYRTIEDNIALYFRVSVVEYYKSGESTVITGVSINRWESGRDKIPIYDPEGRASRAACRAPDVLSIVKEMKNSKRK